MAIRARRLKRVLAAVGGIVGLSVGVLCVASAPTDAVAVAVGVGGYGVATLLLRLERRLRPDAPTRKVPTSLLATIAVALTGASFVAANIPLHGEFSGEACGSVLAPRTPAPGLLSDIECADPRGSMADISLTGINAAGVLALIALRRPRRATTGRVVLTAAVALTILGAGAVPALATDREVTFENSVHVWSAAKPFARAFCDAQTRWANTNVQLARENATKLGEGPLGERRDVLVRILDGMARATRQVRRDRAVAARDFAVSGARTFVQLMDPQMRHATANLESLAGEAREMPVDSEPHFKAAKAKIAARVGSAASVAMPRIPRDHDLATVVATMRTVPECLGMV